MIFLIYLCSIFIFASSDVPPTPPLNVEMDSDHLKWTAADQEDTTHYVQYRLFDQNTWRNVSSCSHISGNSCNLSFARLDADHGCLSTRVYAQLKGLSSKAVEACSRQSDICSPRVRLSSRPGSLKVHLDRDHELAKEYEDHVQYELCYHKPGQPIEFCRESPSSDVVTELDGGETYCVKVQFLHYTRPVGVPSCSQCQEIPLAGVRQRSFMVVVISAVVVGSTVAYVIIFHRNKVKRWLQPEQTPDCLTVALHDVSVSTPTVEHFDHFHLRETEED